RRTQILQHSPLTVVPSTQLMKASAPPTAPGQGAPSASARRPPPSFTRWIEAKALDGSHVTAYPPGSILAQEEWLIAGSRVRPRLHCLPGLRDTKQDLISKSGSGELNTEWDSVRRQASWKRDPWQPSHV